MDYGTDGTMTLTQAGALTEIVGAAQRNAPVARLDLVSGKIVTAQAQYIGADAAGSDQAPRDFAYERDADVRDLFLVVAIDPGRTLVSWPVRDLIAEYAAHTFAVDLSASDLAEPHAVRQMAVLVAEGRRWLADQPWIAEKEAEGLTDDQVRAGIGDCYAGGWARFVADGPHPR